LLEDEFMPTVREYLEDRFPTAEVSSEVYLKSDRFVDFVVDGDGYEIMVEVENRAEDVAEGVMQAQMYSWSSSSALGMVVYPAGTGVVDPEVVGACPSVGVVEVEP